MNNSFSHRSSTGPLRRSKPPGEAEFNALFQLLPGPALLVDVVREQVVQANSAFLRLTAFALNEISGQPLRAVVSDLPSHPLNAVDMISVTLERRNRPALELDAQVRVLDKTGAWVALVFEPKEDLTRNIQGLMERVSQALNELHSVTADRPLRENMNHAMQVIQHLLGVSLVALYHFDNKEAKVWKFAWAGDADGLPDTFEHNDLMWLSSTYIWKPGRRVQAELHRSARVSNLTYLASTPLTQNSLLVIADRGTEPKDHLSIVIESVAREIDVILGHLGSIMDLRRQSLENRRDLLVWRSVGENVQEGILLLAPNLTVSEMNPAAEWMLGYADWEVRGQPVENILIGAERLMTALEMAVEGLPTHNMGNISLHRRNGQSFPAHMQIVPVQREGELLAILISFSDTSEHVEIRNRTQQLEQRAVLGEVTAVFAHEVRNPINNISTGLQLLSVKMPPEDPNQENIARLLNDCQRLNHLMESVLNFSRQVEHKFEEVDLEALLRRLLDRWRPRMAKVSVTSYFQIEPDTRTVLADPRSLEQVFTNLVGNAVEAMSSQGGTLAVRAAPFHLLPGRPQVEVTISDSGPGIPDEIRERIFEPFVTTKQQGTGLGLAITKRIVTAHHGSISVNSFPGGTVFHVILPAYQGENA